jgi:anti-anti-sigma factor
MNKIEMFHLRAGGAGCAIEVRGRFDFNSYPHFKRAMEQALERTDAREFVMDFREAAYLDSSALGMLLNFSDAAQAQGKKLVLAHASGLVLQILEVANFQKLFEMR